MNVQIRKNKRRYYNTWCGSTHIMSPFLLLVVLWGVKNGVNNVQQHCEHTGLHPKARTGAPDHPQNHGWGPRSHHKAK